MKKLIAMILALTLALGVTACGSKKTTDQEAAPSAPETSTTETEQTPAEPEETPAGTEEAPEAGEFTTVADGKLIMATNATFPPYEYLEGTDVAGIDVDIANAVAQKLGLELEVDDMEFNSITESVKNGKADLGLAGMTVTEERLESVDFTVSYATGVQVVVVAEDSAITSVDDLFAEGANHQVGVQLNTTGDIYASDDIEGAGLGTVQRFSKHADAMQALLTGKVDCVILDNEPAKAFVEQLEGLKILDTKYAVEDYAAAMNKENKPLYEAVNNALQELIDDGTIAEIIAKYIPAE